MEGGGGAESVSQLSDSIVGVREVFRVSIRLPMHIDFLQLLPDACIVGGCDHLLLSKAPCALNVRNCLLRRLSEQ